VHTSRGATVLSSLEIVQADLLIKQLEMLKLHVGALRSDDVGADEGSMEHPVLIVGNADQRLCSAAGESTGSYQLSCCEQSTKTSCERPQVRA
jgi:hypothetical protein